jgi:hypothetical protein
LGVFHPTGHFEQDLEHILDLYIGKFSAKNPKWLAKPLQKRLKNANLNDAIWQIPILASVPQALKLAEQALKAQIDSKQDQREHDLAVEYLKKTSNKTGGSQDVSEQAAALVNAQQSKPNKPDNDGPGKKKKNK